MNTLSKVHVPVAGYKTGGSGQQKPTAENRRFGAKPPPLVNKNVGVVKVGIGGRTRSPGGAVRAAAEAGFYVIPVYRDLRQLQKCKSGVISYVKQGEKRGVWDGVASTL